MYFEDPVVDETGDHAIFVHDEPVVCWDCWKNLSEEHKNLHKRAKVKTMED